MSEERTAENDRTRPHAYEATNSGNVRAVVEVEAVCWDGSYDVQSRIVTWARGDISGWFDGAYYLAMIHHGEAKRADPGDYIVRGDQQGEFYPVPADEFEAIYTRVLPPGSNR